MSHVLHILADADYGKLIGLVIFAIIWGISALGSVAKKVAEQNAKARRIVNDGVQRQMMAAQKAARPPAIVRSASTRQVSPPTRQRPVVKVALPPPLKQQAPASAPPLSAVTARQAAQLSVAAPAALAAHEVSKSRLSSTGLQRFLTPGNLRQQIVLSEVLQPPIALRSIDE